MHCNTNLGMQTRIERQKHKRTTKDDASAPAGPAKQQRTDDADFAAISSFRLRRKSSRALLPAPRRRGRAQVL